jgi:acyl carrier protein
LGARGLSGKGRIEKETGNEMSNKAQLEVILTAAAPESGPPSAAVIEEWLVNRIADLQAIEPGEIDVEEQLSVYGLSSLTGVMLSGDIEDWLKIQVEPTLAWEYPTVRALAGYLAGVAPSGNAQEYRL